LLTKFLDPTRGRIFYAGADITRRPAAAVARLGLVRSFQISSVFPHLSALRNVRLALQRARGRSFDFWRSSRVLRGLDAEARELLGQVGLEGAANEPATRLPYGQKRALEIATTLAARPETLLLDEPTAGMGHEDVDRVTALIRKVAQGRTVVMVEHNLAVVERLCDRITVLARGEVLAEGDYAAVAKNPEVVQAYLGTSDD
jgi:branched-chain amino acid transport system ATP-binding protein